MDQLARLRSLFFAFFALGFVLYIPASKIDAVGDMSETIQAVKALRERTGVFRATYELEIEAIFPERDPEKSYNVHSSMKSTIADTAYRMEISGDMVWFPDNDSPAQILPREEWFAFDGDVKSMYVPESRRLTISPAITPPHTNPRNLWLTIHNEPIDEVLLREGVEQLGLRERDGRLLDFYRIPASDGSDGRYYLIGLDAAFDQFPTILEYGTLSGDELDVLSSVDVIEISEDSKGLFYPRKAVQRLYSNQEGQKICFTQRVYTCTEFESNIAPSAGYFKLEVPDDAFVHDSISGRHYRPAEVRAEMLTYFEDAIETAERVAESLEAGEESQSGSLTGETEARIEGELSAGYPWLLPLVSTCVVLSAVSFIVFRRRSR